MDDLCITPNFCAQIKDKYGHTAADLARHHLTREHADSADVSIDEHKSYISGGDVSQPDSQLYSTLNDSTADVSNDREVIVRLLEIADEKIAQWRSNASIELQLMAPVTCWQNCGYMAKFEEMSEHVRNGCPLKPTVCPECRDAFPAHQIPHHRASVCPKRLIACPNVVTGCKEFITADYLHTHVTLRCEYRLVHCRLHCGGEIALCKRQDHEENHCKRRLLLCSMCNEKFPSMELGHHMLQLCPMRQVKCSVGCLGFFNAKDIEHHEKHECVSECRWKCGEVLGPANIRLWHELSACPLRPATCANGCNIMGLTAKNKSIHEMNYCRLARVPCPNNCGGRLPPHMLPAHMDPYTGTCPERSVRCPSNFIGWRVRVGDVEGIVMKYARHGSTLDVSDSWQPDGIDRYYIRFADGHRWVDYWSSDIIPLKKQMNVNKGTDLYPCGWVPYSMLNDHLHYRCCNREVLIGGDAAAVRADMGNTLRPEAAAAFRGQKTIVAESVAMAQKRVEINVFLSDVAPRTCCDYCSNEIESSLMEHHLAKECQHVFVRCKLGCGTKVIKKILSKHMETECPKRNVNCADCGEVLWAEEVVAHLRDACRCRIVPCKYGCGIENLQAGELERHCELECEWRPFSCTCGDVYPLKDRQDHLITTCPKKLGLCPQGCGLEIPRDELQGHMSDHCENKHVYMNNLINCPIRCGARLRRLDILEHVSYHCTMRVTECPFQCGGTFKYNRLKEHISICPNRPLCCEKGMKSCRFLMHQWFYKDKSGGSTCTSRSPSRARRRNHLGGMLEDDEESVDDVSETSSVFEESRILQRSTKLGQTSALSMLTDSYYEGSGPLITSYPVQEADDSSAFTANKPRQRIEFANNPSMDDSVSHATGRKEWVDDLRLLSCPRHGRSLLMYAVKYDEFAMAEFVIRKTGGEDLDIQNRFGDTALTLACGMARLNFVELLVNNGADVNMETVSGKTALIEAVKANAMDIVNLLISVGAIVKFKTYKHSKCAMDWAKILKLADIQRCLEIGELVQAQIEEIFHAISAGDMVRVKQIVGMGDVFYPLNTVRFRVAMEDNAQKLEMSKVTLVRLDRDLDVARQSCNEAVAAYETAHEREVEAKMLSDTQRELCSKMRAEVGFRFTDYETQVYRLSTSDIAEVTSLRTPDRSVLLSVLAYGLLFGVLDARKEYSLDIAEAASWWSATIPQLARTEETLTTMKNFSWAKLQSDFAIPLANKIIAINAELQGLLQGRKDEREAQIEHTRMLIRQVSTSKQETIQAETDVSQFMLMVQLATNNKETVLEAQRRMNKRKFALPGEEEVESDDGMAAPSEDSLPELRDEEWDSDADDAGDGEWVKGKWVPIVKKSKNWWEKHKQKNQQSCDTDAVAPEPSPPKPFVYIGANNDPVTNIQDLQEDDAADELMFVLTIATLTTAVAGMMERMRDIRAEDAKYRALKSNYDDLKKTADSLKVTSETEKSRFGMAENENISERKNMAKYERRLYENKERLRVALLLNRVTASGHTAVSWAAAHGFYAAFEMLILHGATVGYNEELIGLSASVIQNTFRLYHYHSGKTKAGEMSPRSKAQSMMLDDGDSVTAAAHSVEEMFRLQEHREKTIVKIKRMRRRFRFPVPEAAYGGHWDIVMRVIERKLLHVNFMGSWVFPSPPTPRPRIHRRLNYAEKKHSFMSILEAGKEALAGGSIVEGVGWVSPDHESEIFSESVRELSAVWKQVSSSIEAFQNTRRKIRLLVMEKRRQQRVSEQMTFAIKTCNFRECLRLTKEENSTMDFETSEGLTPLIVAAEENVGGLHHEYMVNDDGEPVLAVCFLLDRTYYRPAVNLENAYGVTALIHACSLGREHCVEALIARNANVNRRNRYGETALHAAAKSGSRRCVRMLLESGADADIEDNEGRKAYDVAHGFSFTDVMMQISQINNGFLGPVQVTRGKVMDTVSCVMGCGLALYPHEIEEHSAVCELRDVPCSLGCGVTALLAREHDNHITYECLHREVECPECHAFIRYIDMRKHADFVCPKRLVVCDLGCGSSIRIEDMPKHRVLCSHKLIPCPDNCGETYPMVKRLEHARNHCINRRVPCPLKCTALVVLRVMNNHIKDICPLREVRCKWCDRVMHHRDLKNHMKQCEYQPAPCKAKCGEYVQMRMMDMHLKTECKHRFVPCTLGCRLKVREVDMSRHVTEECGNRLVPCPLKCRDSLTDELICLPIKQIDVHVNYDCKARTVKCGQCTLEILAKDIELHAAVECLKREVSCRLPGCMKKLPFDQREKHETHSCRHRMMVCPSGCGELVLANRLNYHLNQVCGMRYVNCPLGCGVLLRHCVLQEHMDVDCARRPGGRSRRSSRRDSSKSPLATDISCKSPLASDISCRSPLGSDFGVKSPLASNVGQHTPFDYDRSEVNSVSSNKTYSERGSVKFPPVVS